MDRRSCWTRANLRIAGLMGMLATVGCASVPPAAAVSAGPGMPGVAGAGVVAPVAPPYTLWTFLGFDPLFAKLSTKHGHLQAKMATMHPFFGPRLPMKPLTDPSLAQSPNVAVAGAAGVTSKQAEIPQTKAALAAVANVGCACDPATMSALLAGLDSCFPEVRLAAAEAVRKTVRLAEDPCDRRRCCSPELSDKLYRMGWGCDEWGCYLEPEGKVRLAARQAYRACGCMPCPTADPQEGSLERPHADVLKAIQAGQQP